MKLHHLGIATKNIEKTELFINSTHLVKSKIGPVWDKNLKANVCIIEVLGDLSIELVSGPAVESLLKKNISLYHYCYEVDDIDKKIKEFIKFGAVIITNPTPAILFDNRLVTFLLTPIGIIELLNKK